jgi:tetratricopeptide (TPR) repeat protein
MMHIGWTTTSTLEDAEKLALESIEKRIVACAQVDGPIRSYYISQNKPENEEEYRVTFKFISENAFEVEAWLKSAHPYETPQWITVKADRVLPAYLNWAKENTQVESGEISHPDMDATELTKKGCEYLKKRRYNEARQFLLEAYELEKKDTNILIALADLHREIKKFNKAIEYYEQVLELDSANLTALKGIGDAYRGLYQPKRAITYWIRYLEHKQDDLHMMTRLGDSLKKMGNFEQSESYYLKALDLDGDNKYALLGLGSLYYKNENNEKSLECFEKLLGLDESYVAVLTMVGNIYRRNKEYRTAAGYYEKAIKYDPWNAFALYGLGDSLRWLEDYDQAIHYWTKILEKEPGNQIMHSRVGDAYLELGRMDKAMDHYRKSLNIRFDPYALLGLAKIYRNQENFEEAKTCCQEILKQAPDHSRAKEELLKIYEDSGEVDKAHELRANMKH